MCKKRSLIVVMGILVVFLIAGCKSSQTIVEVGLTAEGQLRPCPNSPNCVSTQEDDDKHSIGPIYYETTFEEAKTNVLDAIEKMRGTELITDSATYLHVEFTTRLMKFVDDVEFLFDDERKTLHFRSASRVGYSDMGANRRRMEKFIETFYGL